MSGLALVLGGSPTYRKQHPICLTRDPYARLRRILGFRVSVLAQYPSSSFWLSDLECCIAPFEATFSRSEVRNS